MNRFRSGVKDLEVMVQNVISSAFESISRVEEGVDILDVFHHLSAREVLLRQTLSISKNFKVDNLSIYVEKRAR